MNSGLGQFKNTSTSTPNILSNQVVLNNSSPGIRQNIIDNTTSSMINRIKDNPLFFFNDQSMTKVTFYNINKDHTTLDEAVENTYNLLGKASGLRFDKINNVIIYGLQKFELSFDVGDFGTEASPIEGEVFLPPNTFVPYQESYFTVDHLATKRTLWFRVTAVNIDTFPNGANYYKLSFMLESVGNDINPQVVKEYMYLVDNIGTGADVLVDAELYTMMNMYSELIGMLQKFYYEMFFKEEVQTFVFIYGMYGYHFYDPYLLNFAIRNNLLSYNGYRYIHVQQPAILPPYMEIDYEHTIFRRLEDPNAKLCFYEGFGLLVQDPMSLLTHRIESYYSISFRDDDGFFLKSPLLEAIPYFDKELYSLLPNNPIQDPNESKCMCAEILRNLESHKAYYEIIYSFLNGIPVTSKMLENIKYMCFEPCKELYYSIPILIYIIKATINNITSSETNQNGADRNI